MGRKSFGRGAFSRSRRPVPRHCLTYDGGGEQNAPRRGPARVLSDPRKKKAAVGSTGGEREREREREGGGKRVAGAFCGFDVGNGATKGSPPV